MTYKGSVATEGRAQIQQHDGGPGIGAAFAVLLGLAVGVLAIAMIFVVLWAHDSRGSTTAAPAPMSSSDTTPSYAGAAPANADELAAAHAPFPAALEAAPAGPVVNVHLVLKDVTIQIAPGVKYSAWAWAGGAPGPVIHARQGQRVHITLTNAGAIPHSVDFHAARVAPNVDFIDVLPGKSFSFSFVANDPGVFMYHCGTKPVLMHIANGMYGAIVVDPTTPLPPADKEYVLVASEWYLSTDGLGKPAQFDMGKAHARRPDWMTFNGYAGQYVKHPLTAMPGETVRFWVLDAGPSIDTDFHVVGTMLDRAWVDAGLDSPPLLNVQTATVPAGGGGVFDVKIDKPGLYPFVSHAFASVDEGQVGLLNVGRTKGTMTH
jgi:nitrite reductase (NO-forming)